MNSAKETNYIPLTIAAMLFVLICLGGIYIIPQYEAKYRDVLPGKPLPALTESMVISSRMMRSGYGFVSIICVSIAFVIGFIRPQSEGITGTAYAAIAIFLLVIAAGYWSLRLPFVSISTPLQAI